MEGDVGGGFASDGRPSDKKRAGRRFFPRPKESFSKEESRVSGITFDRGGLIALDRNDRRVLALLAWITEHGMRITVPASALAQASAKLPAKFGFPG